MKKFIIILIITFLFSYNCIFVYADDINEEYEVFPVSSIQNSSKNEKPPVINAFSSVVMEVDSGRILFQKDADTARPMASTTKIMTALLAVENGNLDDTVTVSKRAAAVGGSTMNIKEGEEYTLKELLYGLLMVSGNDAAIAIAEHIGGSVENFANMMTERAKMLGCKNTGFKSPHGLDMEGHQTTARELAMITKEALKIPIINEIVSTKSTTVKGKSLYNTNELLGSYPGADGVKTGFTGKAGRCLVASATQNGMRLISVVLGSPTRNARAKSSVQVLNYCFANYKDLTLLEEGKEMGRINIIKGYQDSIGALCSSSFKYPLTSEENKRIQTKISIEKSLKAPVKKGEVVGKVTILLDGKELKNADLRAACDVNRKDFWYYLKNIFDNWLKIMRPANT